MAKKNSIRIEIHCYNYFFSSWMAFAIPLCLVNLIISWMWISFIGWRQERQHRIPGDEGVDPKAKETHILKVMRQKYDVDRDMTWK